MAFGRVIGAVLVVGVGVAAVAAIAAAPTILRRARPFVREGLKRGMSLYDQVRRSAAEFAEDVDDLVAEVKNDLTNEGRPAPPAAASTDDAKQA